MQNGANKQENVLEKYTNLENFREQWVTIRQKSV